VRSDGKFALPVSNCELSRLAAIALSRVCPCEKDRGVEVGGQITIFIEKQVSDTMTS
jgi:hypothetical protein